MTKFKKGDKVVVRIVGRQPSYVRDRWEGACGVVVKVGLSGNIYSVLFRRVLENPSWWSERNLRPGSVTYMDEKEVIL